MEMNMSGPTVDMVEVVVRNLHDAHPTMPQATLEDVMQALDPTAAAMVRAGMVERIAWAESVSNMIKDLGRNGRLKVELVPDERGYENPVIHF
jgi:hypothetical protein